MVKVRTKEITEIDAKTIIGNFENDISKYYFTPIDNSIVLKAKNLIDKSGKQGLRSLDSIQFATAIALKNECGLFITSDKLLQQFFISESLRIS